ncbi:ACP S-malonyltransferase [Skermanella stibiiresistens SB22]|uniref:Malonyl CoA-acyl carrier protein transacylase n=1 Tax=Skermanella stibiiresistens SB22 TaxID=1385369 RepID=W9H1M8_9PROT|nr:ACP S-malonyltransferase [Skermanella stibiiresistens]EWY39989.1 ACP S-malonyltransferase [Skermanella stibiiresistens SB22]
MTRAFVFPGQGSQAVGMGRELSDAFQIARHTFQEVDEALSQKLSSLMFEGPESDLTLTENAQPALMAVSVAVLRVLEREGGVELHKAASFVAGHSLGEYSALAAAGTFSLADTARLLKLRGQAMQKAVPVGEGAMAALLGLDLAAAQEIAAEAAQGEICSTANDNAPGQVVVSGHRAAVERAIAIAAGKGAKRSILLPVSAPFHCELMAPAAEAMAEALANVELRGPTVPVVANVTAQAVISPDEIRRLLVDQVTGLVRWRESVLFMKEQGVDTLVELGAGKVLSGLAKRIDREIAGVSIQGPADIEAFLKKVS